MSIHRVAANRLPLVLLAILIASIAPAAAEPAATVCNGMAFALAEVTVGSADHTYAFTRRLHPDECLAVRNMPKGTYTIRFTEDDGQRSAICHREAPMAPGIETRITPDDESECLY